RDPAQRPSSLHPRVHPRGRAQHPSGDRTIRRGIHVGRRRRSGPPALPIPLLVVIAIRPTSYVARLHVMFLVIVAGPVLVDRGVRWHPPIDRVTSRRAAAAG